MQERAPLLSLIVPVYQVAPYLPRLFESLATLSADSTEILLIDDGGTDECPELLAAFASGRGHVRVVRRANGGLSAARNSGLEQASGRYLAFTDADDWFDPGYYERLLDLSVEHKLDMAVGNASYHFEGRKADYPIFTDQLPPGVMRGADFLRVRLRRRNFLHMVWMHLYRRELIESHGLRFMQDRIHEDVPWTTRMLLWSERLMYDPTPGYHYRQRIKNADPLRADERLLAVIASSIENARDLETLGAGLAGDPELRQLLRWQMVDGGLSILHKLHRLRSSAARRDCLRDLRRRGVFSLLWRNAIELRQKRRIARGYLKSLAAF